MGKHVQITEDTLTRHHALVRSDNPFQRQARLRQALWREGRGLPIGEHRGRPLGSRLSMPFAEATLANYLTDNIREVVQAQVRNSEKLYSAPRIYNDLLSSQPLCFNLFGELHLDLDLATRLFRRLIGDGVTVTGIEFEHSPGRGDSRFTADGSAFDVFVTYEANGATGFVGIEVKYVENMDVDEARYRPRYDEVARQMGIFRTEHLPRLRVRPLEQLWRDHLLACSLLLDGSSGFERGTFAVLYPKGNTVVESAVTEYGSCLLDSTTFTSWTLEHVLEVMDDAAAGSLTSKVRERYTGP